MKSGLMSRLSSVPIQNLMDSNSSQQAELHNAARALWLSDDARAANRGPIYPGRIDPYTPSQRPEELLPPILTHLQTHGELTPEQNQVIRMDLGVIAYRCLCQGYVSESHDLKFSLPNGELNLDGIDLAWLMNNYPNENLRLDHLFELRGKTTNPQNLPLKIEVPESPSNVTLTWGGRIEGDAWMQLTEFSKRSEYYNSDYQKTLDQDTLHLLQPRIPLDTQKQQLAKQLINQLPPASQSGLADIPFELISRDKYESAMKFAAHNGLLPESLQKFADKNQYSFMVLTALYRNPNIAARIVGLSCPPNLTRKSINELAQPIVSTTVKQAQGQPATGTRLARGIKRFTGQANTSNEMKQLFSALQNCAEFSAQEVTRVHLPFSFSAVSCPLTTAVDLGIRYRNAPLLVHANHISMGPNRKAIAAMQPPNQAPDTATRASAFFNLLAAQPNTTVLDLRKTSDLQSQDSVNYSPSKGQTIQLTEFATGEQVRLTTLDEKPLANTGIVEKKVEIRIQGRNKKELKVLEFRGWPDHGLIASNQLRDIRKVIGQELKNDQRLITHCRAGVGRTGTTLMYEKLYHDLIENRRGATLLNSKGEVKKPKLIEAVAQAVVHGRLERGPLFVQTEGQLNLLYQTLKEDLRNHAGSLQTGTPTLSPVLSITSEGIEVQAPKNDLDQSEQADQSPSTEGASNSSNEVVKRTPLPITPAPQTITDSPEQTSGEIIGKSFEYGTQSVTLPGHRIHLEPNAPSNLVKEPKNSQENWQHWATIFEKGENVVEIVSNINRMVGTKTPEPKGLGAVLTELIKVPNTEERDLQFGPHQVLSIRPAAQANSTGPAIYTQQYQIEYRTEGEAQPKTLTFSQVLTPYNGYELTAQQLNDVLNYLGEDNAAQSKWISSVNGTGRPSAILTAQAIRAGIVNGSITDEASLEQKLDEWTEQGRKDFGRLFINTRSQRQQLIEIGKFWLNRQPNQKSLAERLQDSEEDTKRSKYLQLLVEKNTLEEPKTLYFRSREPNTDPSPVRSVVAGPDVLNSWIRSANEKETVNNRRRAG